MSDMVWKVCKVMEKHVDVNPTAGLLQPKPCISGVAVGGGGGGGGHRDQLNSPGPQLTRTRKKVRKINKEEAK